MVMIFNSKVHIFLSSDFQLDEMTSTEPNTNYNGITPEVREKLEESPYTESSGYAYYADERHVIEPHLKTIWDQYKSKYESDWSDYEKAYWDDVQQ